MPDSFFQSQKKRKRPSRPQSSGGPSRSISNRNAQKGKRKDEDEDLSSNDGDRGMGGDGDVDDMDFRTGREEGRLDDDDLIDENETAAEKRIRMARGYLDKVKQDMRAAKELEGDYDAAEIDRELIASRLQKEVAEAEGRIHIHLQSHTLSPLTHFLPISSSVPTSVSLTSSSIWVSTKRGSIIRYSTTSLHHHGKPFGQERIAPDQKLMNGSKFSKGSKGTKGSIGRNSVNQGGNVESGGHKGEILCVEASEDGKYLVTGGRDKVIGVWKVDGDSVSWAGGMRGHKDAITSISIPPLSNPSHHILTASLSRHLTLHSLSTLSILDTFFGHQDSITSVSSLKPSVAVTAGSRDRTCRWWKVEEEVQLVLRGGGKSYEYDDSNESKKAGPSIIEDEQGSLELDKTEKGQEGKSGDKKKDGNKDKAVGRRREFVEGSIDVVCMLDDQRFISGGDSGSICLWQTSKKKPIYTKALAHGTYIPEDSNGIVQPRWITALAALRGTDLFISGSWDDQIKIWALELPSLRSFKLLKTINYNGGIINDLKILYLPSISVQSDIWSKRAGAKHPQTSIKNQSNGINADPENIDEEEEEEEEAEVHGGDDMTKKVNGDSDKKEILLVAAVGQEHRLGRWLNFKSAKNGILAVHLKVD